MKNPKRREETLNRILEAASTCFINKGYRDTSVADICKEAGVSKGAFYYHFESKQAVFINILNSWLGNLESLLKASTENAQNIPDSLFKMSSILQNVLRPDNEQLSIFLELWNQASRDEEVRKATIKPYRQYRKVLEELIEKGIKEGSLKPVDPKISAQIILSMVSGIFLQRLLDPEGANWDLIIKDSLQILLEGMR